MFYSSVKFSLLIIFLFFFVGAHSSPVYKDSWVIVDNAKIFDYPNIIGRGGYPWATQVTVYNGRFNGVEPGWVPILKSQKNSKLRSSYIWLRHKDLWDGKPKKVLACWPIKRIEYTVGDWAIEINFKPDGSGIAREFHDVPEDNRSPYKIHAYMSQNIVQFNALDKDKRNFFTAGYKPEDRHLYPNGSKDWTEQTLFDEKELKGCTAQPIVKNKTK